jgi:hypothetical protein
MDKETIASIIGTVVRNAGAPLVTYLVASGWLTDENAEKVIVALIAGAAALVWGIVQKIQAKALLEKALRLPAGSSMQSLLDK